MAPDDEQAIPAGTRMVVRIWLPDRPGALGLVASRIGALGADIVGIDVLERSDRSAVDEFAVVLPDDGLVRLLVREIEEVDGVSVEDWRVVDRFPDPRLDALASIEAVCAADGALDAVRRLAAAVHDEFGADWVAVVRDHEVLASCGGDVPSAPALRSLASAAVPQPVEVGDGRTDVAVAPLTRLGAVLFAGRAGHPFRRRERSRLLALTRIADHVGGVT